MLKFLRSGRERAWNPIALSHYRLSCYRPLVANERVPTIRELKDKVVVVPRLSPVPHLIVSSMASYVGLDPHNDINRVP